MNNELTEEAKKQRVKNAISYLIDYFETYPDQQNYETFSDECIINDTLYGLGVALNPEKYRFASGFEESKKVLKEHLD